jgi:hypothetical protein
MPAAERTDTRVTRSRPPNSAATDTTMAPAEASKLRNGSPMSAPNQPPAFPNVSKSAMIFFGPRTICRIDSEASIMTPHPIANRNRSSLRPRWMSAAPTPTRTTGTTNRPRPVNQPTRVSVPRPTGPARLK